MLNNIINAIINSADVTDSAKLAAIAALVSGEAPAAEATTTKKRGSRKKAEAPAEPVAMAAPEAPSVPVEPVAVVTPAEPEFKLLGLAATIEKCQHTKTGADIWVVKVTDNIRDYKAYSERVRTMGGYYYKPFHGFVFKADPRTK